VTGARDDKQLSRAAERPERIRQQHALFDRDAGVGIAMDEEHRRGDVTDLGEWRSRTDAWARFADPRNVRRTIRVGRRLFPARDIGDRRERDHGANWRAACGGEQRDLAAERKSHETDAIAVHAGLRSQPLDDFDDVVRLGETAVVDAASRRPAAHRHRDCDIAPIAEPPRNVFDGLTAIRSRRKRPV
jgi:hypothetical protein